jgi:hypothetical protein
LTRTRQPPSGPPSWPCTVLATVWC